MVNLTTAMLGSARTWFPKIPDFVTNHQGVNLVKSDFSFFSPFRKNRTEKKFCHQNWSTADVICDICTLLGEGGQFDHTNSKSLYGLSLGIDCFQLCIFEL